MVPVQTKNEQDGQLWPVCARERHHQRKNPVNYPRKSNMELMRRNIRFNPLDYSRSVHNNLYIQFQNYYRSTNRLELLELK